jgi:tetratricopeptide (TPR) repeat protein
VSFSVIDKGRKGTNTPAILNQIESYLFEYRPDMVVTMMGINDWGEHIPFEAATVSRGVLLIRSFKTYKLARLLWLHILIKAREIKLYKPNEVRRSPEEVQIYLQRIRSNKACVESISPEDTFKKAIELNPKNDNVYIKLGWFYLGQGKLSEAENLYKKAIELNPKNDNACIGLGWTYREQGKLSEAEDAFKKAIELNPKNDNAFAELGWTYREQGKLSEVEDAFKKVIELNPKNDNACIRLGWFYLGQGKLSEAENLYKKAIELNPKNNKAYGTLSVIYEEMGKSELAKEYAEKFNKLRLEYCALVTVNNYRKLQQVLNKRKIKLVCVQYPMRNVESLKRIFQGQDKGIIFVDNESIFKEVLKKVKYKEYFKDKFGGNFGHCTEKGNRLLAQNIANTILKEVFKKSGGALN